MWSKERRKVKRSIISRYGFIGFILASGAAFSMHQYVSEQGHVEVKEQAVSDASLIVDLTSGFVRTYSKFSVNFTNGELPSPQLFRANALQHIVQDSNNSGLVSTGVIGIPGREISKTATEDSMRNLLLVLEASRSTKVASAVIEKEKQTLHRSLWAFYATEQACADCHNRIQNLTGSDRWQVGDLMGAQTVDLNVNTAFSIVNRNAIVQAVLLFIAVVAAWLCCLYLINQLQLNREFKRLATTDHLTGCINRRELHDRVTKMKGIINGAVLMLDLDKFKQINDTFGHQAGDKVIEDFGTTLRNTLREEDWAVRFGGEEFIVWLPDVEPIDAIKMAERFLTNAQQAQVVVEGKRINYTVSIGLHIVQDAPPTLFETWMKSADKLLYRAKEEGRNKIVCEINPNT